MGRAPVWAVLAVEECFQGCRQAVRGIRALWQSAGAPKSRALVELAWLLVSSSQHSGCTQGCR